MHAAWARVLAGAVLAGVALAGCSGGSDRGTGGRSGAPATPGAEPSAAPSPSASPGPPDPAVLLPADCDGLASRFTVGRTLGVVVRGPARFLRDVPQPTGRLGRVTCTYRLEGRRIGQLVATENLYADPATARGRIADTVAADRRAGNRFARVAVAGLPGARLDGDRHATTLLASSGPVVLVLTLDRRVLIGDQARIGLTRLAAAAAAGMRGRGATPAPAASGSAAASPAPSPSVSASG